MNKVEASIGSRVRQFRENIKWQQPAFAYELGISRNKLASIEHGHTPLRYDLAKRLCERFDLSQYWLAKGIGRPNPRIPFSSEIEGRIPTRLLFSHVFTSYLLPLIGDDAKKIYALGKRFGVKVSFITPLGLPSEKRLEWMLSKEVQSGINAVPLDLRREFYQDVIAAICRFYENHQLKLNLIGYIRPRDWPKDRRFAVSSQRFSSAATGLDQTISQNDLTNKATSLGSEVVKGKWLNLKKQIQKATTDAGSKSKLAAFLDVDLTQLSKWLTDSDSAREPGAEYTLQMQAWVNDRKRQ